MINTASNAAVMVDEIAMRVAAEECGIPSSTLSTHIKIKTFTKMKLGRYLLVFTRDQEMETTIFLQSIHIRHTSHGRDT